MAFGAYWTATVDGKLTALAVADLDQDGWAEIMGGTDEGHVIVWTADGRPLWDFAVETDWVTSLSAADLDGDGRSEVLVTAAGILPTGYLYVLRTDGSLRWSHQVREELWTALPFDLDTDSAPEILLAAQRPAALETDGRPYPDWPASLLRTPYIRRVDWDGDGADEVVALSPDAFVIIESNGESRAFPIALQGEIRDTQAGDVDGDGHAELIVLTGTELALFGNDGALRWTWPLRGEPGELLLAGTSPNAAGRPLILLSDDAGILALEADGHKRWEFDDGLSVGRPFVMAAYEDLLVAAAPNSRAYLLNAEGQRLAEYGLDAPASRAQVADLNGDGYPEVLLGSSGTVSVFGAPSGSSEIRARWSQATHDPTVTLAPADVNGDGMAEVMVGGRGGRAMLLEADGRLMWQHADGDQPGGVAVAESDGFLMWAGPDLRRHDSQGLILWEASASGTIREAVPTAGEAAALTNDGQVEFFSWADGQMLRTLKFSSPIIDLVTRGTNIASLTGDGLVTVSDDGGAQRWQTDLGRPAEAAALAPDGSILVRSGTRLIQLDTNGTIIAEWATQAAERVIGVAAGQSLVAVATDGRIVTLDTKGDEIWSRPFKEVPSSVAVMDVDGDGMEDIAAGTVKGSVVLLSSAGEEVWRGKGRERVNVLTTADLNGDGEPEILAGFEDGAVLAYGFVLDQPPWLGSPAVTAVGDGYQYVVRVQDPDGDPVTVTLETWDPSAGMWKPQGSAVAASGSGTLTWNLPDLFDTWDAGKDSAFRFTWEAGRRTGRAAASRGPLRIPVDPWYVTYGRAAGLAALIAAVPGLLFIIVRRARAHRLSPLGQAEAALLRLTLDPGETLSELHHLLSDEARAETLLAHLPGLARQGGHAALGDLLEGAHLILSRPEVMPEALREVLASLDRLTTLPLANETRRIYASLHAALTAGSISEVVPLRGPLSELSTSLEGADTYLAPTTAMLGRLGSIARTLRASEQVEASSDRIAYLAEAAADLGYLEQHAHSALSGLERRVAVAVIQRWRGLVIEAVEQLRGRAEIGLILRTRQLMLRERVTLALTLTNTGRSPATDLAVELLPGEGLSPTAEPTPLPVLPPGSNVRLEVPARTGGAFGSFDVVFRSVWDDRERARKEARFAERVRLMPTPREFAPIPNPYTTGRPLAPGSPVFVGRADLFDFVAEKLDGGHIVVLIGERRMGKTSLLRQLPSRLGARWAVAYLDGQGLGLEGGLDHWLADAALEVARAVGDPVACPCPADFNSQPGPTFEAYLRHMASGLPEERRLLVLLDEFEEIEARVRTGHLPPTMFSYLRHLLQFGEIRFLLAGTQRLEKLSPEYWTPLFNLGVYRQIGPLDEVAARQLITAPVEDRLLYDDLAIDKLLRLSGGQPYFLQLLCHCVVTLCNRGRLAYATVAEVEAVVDEALMLGQAHLRFLWASATPDGRAALAVLARLTANGEPGTTEAMAAGLAEAGMAPDVVATTLAHLTTLGLTSRSTDGRYTFAADLIRLWGARGVV